MSADSTHSSNIPQLDLVSTIYFIGVGGIGMSALARYFNSMGKFVFGYDKTQTPLTNQLEKEGIQINYSNSIEAIPQSVSNVKKEELLVIYTPAIPADFPQIKFFNDLGINLHKRSEALGIIIRNTKGLAVAGTHGKTTTSTILAHILNEYKHPVSAFLGGISVNFNSNFFHVEGSSLSVVEADEYDRSFLTLHPYGSIITSTDADHLDIYGEEDHLLKSFNDFSNQTSNNLVVHEDVVLNHSSDAIIKRYGESNKSDYRILSRKIEAGICKLDIKHPEGTLNNISFPMAGNHNSLNALAALALGAEIGLDIEKLALGLASFKGIKRRFEIHINSSDCAYIDDYAHHPTELRAAILAARELFPEKKLVGIFQPHLFSRTKDFANEFAESLSLLDQLILLDIYPAREKPIPGITSNWLMEQIDTSKVLLSKSEAVKWVIQNKPDLLITLGAGDIDQLIEPIKTALS